MRIQFEIKETLPQIISEIENSDKWQSSVKEEQNGLKRIIIKDPVYESKAYIDIWENEIHIKTAWSNYTYRIFRSGNVVVCEYIGAYRGLLEQVLLPRLTPIKNILDVEVLDSSITGTKHETLRQYAASNLRLKNERRENTRNRYSMNFLVEHPMIVYDEYIKEGMPMPSVTNSQ